MLFSMRPVFIGWIALVSQLPIQLFMTVWAGGFFGGITKSVFGIARDSNAPFFFSVSSPSLGFRLSPISARN